MPLNRSLSLHMASFYVRYVFVSFYIPTSKSACVRQILIRFLAVADNDPQKDVSEWLKIVSICMSSALEHVDGHEVSFCRSREIYVP
jgi:hypothetical protein